MNFNNASPIDIKDATKKINDESPGLLLQDERIDMAFKAIRDKFFFTSHRVLIKDKQGITGKKIEYKSCPYHSIKAFSCETAGSMDSDVELKIYGAGLDISIDFDKEKIDIFEIQKYISGHVFVDSIHDLLAFSAPSPQVTVTQDAGGKASKLIDYLAGDSVRLDENVVENELRNIGAIVPNENVKLAYKCGRDSVICTSKRMMYIDAQGISGKRIEYLSMRYSCIQGYEVETAGNFLDRDAEFKIFTNLSQEKREIKTEIRKDQSDIMEVLWYFNNQLLGMDDMPMEEFLPMAKQSSQSDASSFVSWLGDDMAQIDARQVDQQFHSNPPLLQSNEFCEMAFKGRRDLVLFTTKRILFVDKQGWSGKKMAFKSFPYRNIKVFQVTTAGKFDKDMELGFYTDIWFDPPKCNGCENGCGNEEPTPGNSFLEIDINKHTSDILGLYRYLASKVYATIQTSPDDVPFQAPIINPSPPGAIDKFLNYFGQDMVQLDPQQLQQSLSPNSEMPVLGIDEVVLMGFKCGRDSTIFTSRGILDIDVQGFSGKRIEFRNTPYRSIRSFSAESAGSFDTDSELKLILCTPWLPKISRDFRSGKADIVAIQNLIAAKTLGPPGKPSDFANDNTIKPSNPGSMEKMIAYLNENNVKIDPKSIESKFKSEVPILQPDENVELAYQCGRDMFLLTNKRGIQLDVQGISGKKLEFVTLPYKYISAFSVESASLLSRTVSATLFVSKIRGGNVIDFGKKTDIFEINNCLANKLLMNTTHQT